MCQAARRVFALFCPAFLSGSLIIVITSGSMVLLVRAALADAVPEAGPDPYEACLAAASGDGTGALALADTLEAAGRDRAASHCRALAYETLERPGDAAAEMIALTDALEEAGANGETRLSAMLSAADFAWQADDLATVDAMLDRASGIDPDAPAVLVRRAALLRARGEAQAAVDLLATKEWETPGPEILLERGLANVDTGRLPAARADWVRLIALYPDSAAADAARRNLDRLDAAMELIETEPLTLLPLTP